MGYYADRARQLISGVLRRNDPAILMYHRVAEAVIDPWGLAVCPDNFAAHLRELKRVRKPVPLDEMVEKLRTGKPEKGTVAITFDDAYRDVLTKAKPILEEYDVPAAVFVVTGKIGEERGYWWDRLAAAVLGGTLPAVLPTFSFTDAVVDGPNHAAADRSAVHMELWKRIRLLSADMREAAVDEVTAAFEPVPDAAAPVMTEAELGELVAGGLISIGAHSVTHPSLPSLSTEEQRTEIGHSRDRLETLLRQPVRRLAYPFGDYDERSMAIAHELGFDYAVSVEAGKVGDPAARFRLPRYDVKNWTGAEFRQRLRWTL